jgi:hypothetical protein
MTDSVSHGSVQGSLTLAQKLPRFLRRILVAGELLEPFRSQLPELGASVVELPLLSDGDASVLDGSFDAILYNAADDSPHDIVAAVARFQSGLAAYGLLYVVLQERPRRELVEIRPLIETRELSCYEAHERQIGPDTSDDPDNLGRVYAVFVIVSNSYDPLLHAREAAASGDPRLGAEVLSFLPRELLLADKEITAIVAVEKQRYGLTWHKVLGAAAELPGGFFQAQMEFYVSIYFAPTFATGYRQQAEFWTLLGNNAMAARLLRSIQRVSPDPATGQMLDAIDLQVEQPVVCETPPRWTGGAHELRILVITHGQSDYGMDSLYDGLCTVLGAENVTEFPWKPCLHGHAMEAAGDYPCTFDRPGTPMTAESVIEALGAGHFNLILFADMIEWDKAEVLRSFLAAAPRVPVVVYDSWDDCSNQYAKCTKYLDGREPDLYFKREMLACVDYGPRTVPLPFSYPADRVPSSVTGDRARSVFWAGNKIFGLRRLYTDVLSEDRGLTFDRKYSPAEYGQVLATSRIGLDFFGLGFDTVRYWELPAHGCMLLAERRPIRIPHDFEDGKSAVFFDDLPDLEEKLSYFDSRPDLAAEIAESGHEHLKRFHTNTARAQQFLAWVEARTDCPALAQ